MRQCGGHGGETPNRWRRRDAFSLHFFLQAKPAPRRTAEAPVAVDEEAVSERVALRRIFGRELADRCEALFIFRAGDEENVFGRNRDDDVPVHHYLSSGPNVVEKEEARLVIAAGGEPCKAVLVDVHLDLRKEPLEVADRERTKFVAPNADVFVAHEVADAVLAVLGIDHDQLLIEVVMHEVDLHAALAKAADVVVEPLPVLDDRYDARRVRHIGLGQQAGRLGQGADIDADDLPEQGWVAPILAVEVPEPDRLRAFPAPDGQLQFPCDHHGPVCQVGCQRLRNRRRIIGRVERRPGTGDPHEASQHSSHKQATPDHDVPPPDTCSSCGT